MWRGRDGTSAGLVQSSLGPGNRTNRVTVVELVVECVPRTGRSVQCELASWCTRCARSCGWSGSGPTPGGPSTGWPIGNGRGPRSRTGWPTDRVDVTGQPEHRASHQHVAGQGRAGVVLRVHGAAQGAAELVALLPTRCSTGCSRCPVWRSWTLVLELLSPARGR